jgi:hypothetical protein
VLGSLLEQIRTSVLSVSGVTVERSYVAGGPDWAVEDCTQLVVWLQQPRPEYQGAAGNRPTQGVGIPAVACGVAPVYDIGVAYYAGCYPRSDDEDPVPAAEFHAWTPGFLDDVEAVHLALIDLTLPTFDRLLVGTAVPASPSPGGFVAGYRWPCSLFPIMGVEFGSAS